MRNEAAIWRHPGTPWELVRKKHFGGVNPDIAKFARDNNLLESDVRQVFEGRTTIFSPAICFAFSRETAMSEEYFRNLSEQYQRRAA